MYGECERAKCLLAWLKKVLQDPRIGVGLERLEPVELCDLPEGDEYSGPFRVRFRDRYRRYVMGAVYDELLDHDTL